MEDLSSANPETGADNGPLTVNSLAERLRGKLSGEPATENTEADAGEAVAQTEQPEVEAPEQEAEAATESDDTPTEAEQPEEQPKRKHRVKVNGEELEVTFDELRNGYQRDADYRQKTAKLADERRQLEAERAHIGQQLKAFIPALQAQLQDKFGNVDWVKLAQENPAEYVQKRAEYDEYSNRMNLALAEQRRIEKQTQDEIQANYRERLKVEADRLAEKLPDYNHPEKGKTIRAEIKSYLQNEGFTDDDLKSVVDHRAIVIAHKAMLYDKAQKARTVVAQEAKAKNVPKVQKPGTTTKVDPKSAALSAAQQRFQKTGRPDDLAEVLRLRRQ